jgi:hypothetical protein
MEESAVNVDILTFCQSATMNDPFLSIEGAFAVIVVDGFPLQTPPWTIALRLTFGDADVGEHDVKVNVIDPDGNVLAGVKWSMIVAERSMPQNGVLAFQEGIVFTRAGDHAIDVRADGRELARSILSVRKRGTPKSASRIA